MNYNASAAKRCGIFITLTCVYLVIIDDLTCQVIPNFNPESVSTVDTGGLSVYNCEQESVITRFVYRSGPSTLRLRPGNHQPLKVIAAKTQICSTERELKRTGRDNCCI